MKEFEQAFDILHNPTDEELVKAAAVAWKGFILVPLSRIDTKMGIEPVISMIANITKKVLRISLKLIN